MAPQIHTALYFSWILLNSSSILLKNLYILLQCKQGCYNDNVLLPRKETKGVEIPPATQNLDIKENLYKYQIFRVEEIYNLVAEAEADILTGMRTLS